MIFSGFHAAAASGFIIRSSPKSEISRLRRDISVAGKKFTLDDTILAVKRFRRFESFDEPPAAPAAAAVG